MSASLPVSQHRLAWVPMLLTVILLLLMTASAQANKVTILKDTSGQRLQVDGKDMMVLGMNWDYFPIGTNYSYDLWSQSDEFIKKVLAHEMPLMRSMGVNAIRVYVGMPARWIQYIYEEYGMWTMLNHPMARYGFNVDGVWIPSVDYSDPRLREVVEADILEMVESVRDTPGLLLWLLGNENNYGLHWTSNEIEALPSDEQGAARALHLYTLFNDITKAIKAIDGDHPVAICNGDLQYIDIIEEQCTDIDIFGSNVYRGISMYDFYEVVRDRLGVPVLFTEFGADAWNAKFMREDQVSQAAYLLGQWQEIYEQSAGKGRVGNCIGGFTFQWVDGWWKFRQTERLDIHDTNASWPNGGYPDFVEGENNMNEEWWGICAKGPSDNTRFYEVFPRAAYYALRDAYLLDAYAPETTLEAIRAHFARIDPTVSALLARADKSSLEASNTSRVRVSNVRMEFETFNTGGSNISTPPAEEPQETLPAFLGFDHLQSFWVDFQAKPAENVVANLSLSILGHVPLNPIDEIFYENRGRQQTLVDDEDNVVRLEGIERVKVYRADVSWEDRWFSVNGFYRTGHLHWGYEGDFFGIYRDAYYGENIDIYNGEAPVGAEWTGKKALSGLKLAFGPELWWGANPQWLVKYRRQFGGVTATAMYQDEFARQSTVTSSIAIPVPPTQRATLALESGLGPFDVTVGGIWGGATKVGDRFLITEDDGSGGYNIFEDTVRDSDTFGGKAKIGLQRGRWNWYAQGAYQGIVADNGPTAIITYTGWSLKDTGLGNGTNFLTGLAVNAGKWQVAPNFLWQKPLVGPISKFAPTPARPRNIQDDPFAVRANRETVAGELMLTYDPTPATWMWAWDNIIQEDARFAGSLGFVFRHLPTTQDAALGVLADGNIFAFPGAPPPRDLWELRARITSKLSGNTRLVAHLYTGTGEPNGDDERLIRFHGADARIASGRYAFAGHIKVDEWGPYDYQRDFNLTFPLQLMGDASVSLGKPRWFGWPQTRFGLRGTWRSLNVFSPRYCPGTVPDLPGTVVCDPELPGDDGSEWEIRTYLHVTL